MADANAVMSVVEGVGSILTDIGAIVTEGNIAKKQMQITQEMFEEQMEAEEERFEAFQEQQGWENRFSEAQFDFGKMKWGKEFGLTKRDWQAGRRDAAQAAKQASLDRLTRGIQGVGAQTINQQNIQLSRYR